MPIPDVLARLDPLQQQVVALVYGEGRTIADAARTLSLERAQVGSALARVFRQVADWVIDEDTVDDAGRERPGVG